jgi:hypothetical protein
MKSKRLKCTVPGNPATHALFFLLLPHSCQCQAVHEVGRLEEGCGRDPPPSRQTGIQADDLDRGGKNQWRDLRDQ